MAKVILKKLVPSNSPIYRQPLQIGGCFGDLSIQIVNPIKKREPKIIVKPKRSNHELRKSEFRRGDPAGIWRAYVSPDD